jgi:hypothetical protein
VHLTQVSLENDKAGAAQAAAGSLPIVAVATTPVTLKNDKAGVAQAAAGAFSTGHNRKVAQLLGKGEFPREGGMASTIF